MPHWKNRRSLPDAALLAVRPFGATRQRMLELKDAEVPRRSLHLGVTELSAITWLPRLAAKLQTS
jgi:hypothetical protein